MESWCTWMGSTSQELGVSTGLQKHKIQNTGFQQICFKTANLRWPFCCRLARRLGGPEGERLREVGVGVGHPLWVSLRLCNTSSGGRHPRASEYRPGIALPFLRLLFIVLRACRPKYLSILLMTLLKVVGSDYVGSHWLASFLLHALEQRAETWTKR